MFQSSHLPLAKWFHAIVLLHTQSVSAMRLAREIGVSYESAWSVGKRIRAAMAGEHAELCRRIAMLHNSLQNDRAREYRDEILPGPAMEAETVLHAG